MVDSIRVLHVDDDSDFGDLTATYLEREDDRISVETATSAADGLDSLTDTVDCIVSDYEMPGTNGIEFLETVRESYPDLPFILYTGRGSEEVASDAISAGVTDYLQKGHGSEQYELLANRLTNAVEQARARRQADKHYRVSTVVRDVNRALVEATSREEISHRVCQIITDADPYVFAWIGTVDATTDRIEPQAAAGLEDGYLDAITVTLDDSPTGSGPGGTAYREDRVVVSQDIQADEAFRPWRDQALDRGYRAVAAIPLSHDDTQYGLLGVYADRPHAFDEAERELLAELGDTIAQAYHRLEIQHAYEDQYRELFEEAPVMFAFTREVDGEPVIEDCNQLFADTLGYTREELSGTRLADVYTEESAAALLNGGGYDRALSGAFVREQRALATSDGDVVSTLLRATPRPNSEGDVIGTYALFVDITDQSRLQTLETLRERMEFALDATDSVLFERNLESGQETRHGPVERLYGRSVDGVDTNETFYETCVHPDDRQKVRAWQRQEERAEQSGTVGCEFRTNPEWGETRWIRTEAFVRTGPDGTPRTLIGLETDITATKEHERRLQRQRDRLAAVFDSVPHPIVEVEFRDQEPIVQQVNDAFEETFGYPRERVTGDSLDDYIVPEEYREEATDLNQSATDELSIEREVERVTADGERRIFFFCSSRVSEEEASHWLGAYIDITGRQERMRELERQNERLEEFAGIVSHDLRNPLNVAQTRLELAGETQDTQDSPHLADVADAHDRMERLIDDLLTLARQGETVREMSPVSLRTLAEDCWDGVQTRGATLDVETDLTIRADRSRLEQLFENLIRNSVEHGSTGSRSGADDAVESGDTDVTVRIGDLADTPGFYVADDGPGIPEDERDEVFESGYSTADEGTGFGLAIVREIAEAHDWDLSVTDSETGGARFEITGVERVEW